MELSSATRPITMRAGSGLGDSLYLQSAARYFVEKGKRVEVHSDWPDVFLPLADRVTVTPFSRVEVDHIVHYTAGKTNPRTTQWQDCLARAGIKGDADLRLDWKTRNVRLVERIRSSGKPVIAVALPRTPMNRKDNFGNELLPNCAVIQRVIDAIGDRAFKVQIGSGDALYHFSGIDLDLSNGTTVADLIDAASASDGFLGYVSFVVPLAESLKKPALLVWSRRGLESDHDYIRTITPRKILHRPSSRAVMDDCSNDDLMKATDALLAEARITAAL